MLKRRYTARERLETWANVSRVQTDEETYGLLCEAGGEVSDIRFHVTSCELHADGYHVCCLEVSDELARLRAENAALRKDGWQLVPKNPTADMRIAFERHCGPADTFYAAYTAMLDAAIDAARKEAAK